MPEMPAWGVHVTLTSVRGVKLVREGDGYRVLAHDQIEFAEDIEEIAGLDRFGPLAHALVVFSKRHDLSRSKVFVSIDSWRAFNRFVAAPMTQGEELMRLLAIEAQQQVPFDLDEVYWDHKVIDVRDDDAMVDVMLFAIKKEVVDDRLRRLQKLRFPVDGVQLSPVALYNFAVREHLAKDGYAVVSVDYDHTDLVICHEKRFWFRSIPEGSHTLVEAVRDDGGFKHRSAVRMVRGSEACPKPDVLSQASQAVSERLSRTIAQTLAYYEGVGGEATKIKGIVVVPGSTLTPLMSRDLKEQTGKKIYAIKGFRHLEIDPAIVTPEISESVAQLAHAAGLALQGLGGAEVDIKLQPSGIERVFAGRRMFHVLSIMAVFLLVGLMWWRSSGYMDDLEERLATLRERTEEARASGEAFESARRDVALHAEIQPVLDVGQHRLVAVNGLGSVVEALARANAGRDEDNRLYLVSSATRNLEMPDTPGIDQRATRVIDVTVGRVQDGAWGDVNARLTAEVRSLLVAIEGVRDVEMRESFAAAELGPVGSASVKDRLLRRKFVIQRFELVYSETVEGGNG